MKYYILHLKVRTGEIEVVETSLHARWNKEEPFDPDEYAKNYYDGGVGEDGSYEFMDGNVVVEVEQLDEVTKAEYKVLSKYL